MTLFGQFDNLLLELNREEPACYKHLLRVDADVFGDIFDRNKPNSTKIITSHLRILASSLRAVATGLRLFRVIYESFTEKSIRGHS